MKTFEEEIYDSNRRFGLSEKRHLVRLLTNETPVIPPRQRIPEEDLIIIEKLYHKVYPDCGRKRGALLRYIKFFRNAYEPPAHQSKLIKILKRLKNET